VENGGKVKNMKEISLIAAGSGAGSQDTPEERTVALEYLQGIYNDPTQSTSMRMRAAIECLPFENPKLSATAIATMDGNSFAEALDRCIARSKSPPPKVIEHTPQLDAATLKKPMARYRRFGQ
jgi:hypothetical protein